MTKFEIKNRFSNSGAVHCFEIECRRSMTRMHIKKGWPRNGPNGTRPI